MKIKWYGTASLLIEEGGTRILLDPYLKKFSQLPPVDEAEARTASAIFITHPHFDHLSDVAAFCCGQPVYLSQNGILQAERNGIPTADMRPVRPGDEVAVGGLNIRVYNSRHCKFDIPTVLRVALNPLTYCRFASGVRMLRLHGKFKTAGDVYAYEISGGGRRIVVLGSAGMDKDEVYPQNADLLVFPYQGRSRMHAYIKKFLSVFRPKRVMADHFDNAFPPITHKENLSKFPRAVAEVLPDATAFVPEEGKWYEV